MRDVRTAVLAAATLVAGCVDAPEVEGRRAAVGGGVASTRTAAVYVQQGTGGCSGAIVGPRHVLTPSFCAVEPLMIGVGTSLTTATAYPVIEVHVGDPSTVPAGEPVAPAILVTSEPLGVTPLDPAAAPPPVDATLLLVGYGDSTGSGGSLTEGAIRVTSVDTDTFVATGVGSVQQCVTDQVALNAADELAGLAVFGTGAGGGVCYENTVYLTISEWAPWIAEVVTGTAPGTDAGPAGSDAGPVGADAGTAPGDAGAAGSDAGTAGSDAGTSTPPGRREHDRGCGCAVPGTRSSSSVPALVSLVFVLGVALRRRRRSRSRPQNRAKSKPAVRWNPKASSAEGT